MSGPHLECQEFVDWLADVSGSDWLWFVKYLSANDTYAKPNVHQGGPHLAKEVFARAFPVLSQRADREKNPDLALPTTIDSHGEARELRIVWYNSKRLQGRSNGRDEARITQWGGEESPIVEPDATGSLVLFAFKTVGSGDANGLRVWRCRSTVEEDHLLSLIPSVTPGAGQVVSPYGERLPLQPQGRCSLQDDEIPMEWRTRFPSGEELAYWAVQRIQVGGSADERLLARRICEEAVFYSVERYHALPRIADGFDSVEAFVEFAISLTNRRKSRSGRSLELQIRLVLDEESVPYSWTPKTEEHKAPDFIFPSIKAYRDKVFAADRLRMLAVKTTCKDRWRQILNEADRIQVKHLLTLQEGVSEAQFHEMQAANVQLVVPKPRISSYPESVQPHLISLEDFVRIVRGIGGEARPVEEC